VQRKLIALALSILLVSCASETSRQAHFDAIRKASLESGICTIHHVPLERTVVYTYQHFDVSTLNLDQATLTVWSKYPNIIDPYAKKTRTADYEERRIDFYCPECQRRYEREVKRWRFGHPFAR
jgi:hypothetical protein